MSLINQYRKKLNLKFDSKKISLPNKYCKFGISSIDDVLIRGFEKNKPNYIIFENKIFLGKSSHQFAQKKQQNEAKFINTIIKTNKNSSITFLINRDKKNDFVNNISLSEPVKAFIYCDEKNPFNEFINTIKNINSDLIFFIGFGTFKMKGYQILDIPEFRDFVLKSNKKTIFIEENKLFDSNGLLLRTPLMRFSENALLFDFTELKPYFILKKSRYTTTNLNQKIPLNLTKNLNPAKM